MRMAEVQGQLVEIFSATRYKAMYTTSKTTFTCIRCGRQAKTFRNSSARLEYVVSALCQACQDDLFTDRCQPAEKNSINP